MRTGLVRLHKTLIASAILLALLQTFWGLREGRLLLGGFAAGGAVSLSVYLRYVFRTYRRAD